MNSTIEDYEHLSSLTTQMRISAAQGKWDQLVALEAQCKERIAVMQQDVADAPDSDAYEATRKRKAELIRKILSDDAEIRNYTMPWMAQLQLSIHGSWQESRLHKTYPSEAWKPTK